MSSDLEHWFINATVHQDQVEEIHFVSNPAKDIRRKPQTTTWNVERFLGRGCCGEVRLERGRQGYGCEEDYEPELEPYGL